VDGDEIGREVHHMLAELGEWMREPNAPRVGLVAVDYFQKLQGDPNAHSRLHELQNVADTLRRFAKGARLSGESDADTFDKRFAVPVLVGAQVNRLSAQSTSETGHPTGDSIREGDDLLNDAAAVVALSWANAPAGDAVTTDALETVRWLRVSVPKHRGGRTRGTFGDEVARVRWYPGRMWIADECARRANRTVAWDTPERPNEGKPDTSALTQPSVDELLRGGRK
jgi:replicative DNA helicase